MNSLWYALVWIVCWFETILSIPYKACDGIETHYFGHYNILKSMFTNCTHVKGSLTLYSLQPEDDLDFLKNIEVIDGYLSIRSVGTNIPLINLKVIKGERLYKRYYKPFGEFALYIDANSYHGRDDEPEVPKIHKVNDPYMTNEMFGKMRRTGGVVPALNYSYSPPTNLNRTYTHLNYLQFYSLTDILQGGIFINYNVGLCFAEYINWYELIGYQKRKNYISFARHEENLCPVKGQECPRHCNGSCWDLEHCQIQFDRICNAECPAIENYKRPACRGTTLAQCCNPECVNGCTGPYDTDCYMCRMYTQPLANGRGKRCLATCEGASNGQTLHLHDNFTCVSSCPSKNTVLFDQCLNQCPTNTREIFLFNKTLSNYCLPNVTRCHSSQLPYSFGNGSDLKPPFMWALDRFTHCPRVCKSVVDIYSYNIHELRGCNIVIGDLNLLEVTVLPQRHPLNDTHNKLVRQTTLAELDQLRSIKAITGYLRIQILTPDITNLDFFDNLEYIGGRTELVFKRYSFNAFLTDLEHLGTRSLRNIPGGGIGIYSNENLCYLDNPSLYTLNGTLQLYDNGNFAHESHNVWTHLTNTLPKDIHPFNNDYNDGNLWLNDTYYSRVLTTQNGDYNHIVIKGNAPHTRCAKEGRICDEQCFSPTTASLLETQGCWGPGPHRCVSCANSILYIPIIQDTIQASILPNSTMDIVNALKIIQNFLNYSLLHNDLWKEKGEKDTTRSKDVLDILGAEIAFLLEDFDRHLAKNMSSNFYSRFYSICVPTISNNAINKTYSPSLTSPLYDKFDIKSWITFYKSHFDLLEQIIPRTSVSLSGDEFTFADMKLQINKFVQQTLGQDLGLGQLNHALPQSLLVYAYESDHIDKQNPIITEKMKNPASGHIFRLCHHECEEGCLGAGPSACKACKHLAYNGTCMSTCPQGTYPNYGQKICQPCHPLCFNCTGPLDRIDKNGCSICALSHSIDGHLECLRKHCRDGYYVADDDTLNITNVINQRPKICKRCHDLCFTCDGPSHSDCRLCRYYTTKSSSTTLATNSDIISSSLLKNGPGITQRLHTTPQNTSRCTTECPFRFYGLRGITAADLPKTLINVNITDPYWMAGSDAFRRRRILQSLNRCACHDECATLYCLGPLASQCVHGCRAYVLFIQQESLSPSHSYINTRINSYHHRPLYDQQIMTCVPKCPENMKVIERNGMKICTANMSSNHHIILNSSVGIFLFVLFVLIIIWRRRYAQCHNDAKKHGKKFVHLLANSSEYTAILDDSTTSNVDELINNYLSHREDGINLLPPQTTDDNFYVANGYRNSPHSPSKINSLNCDKLDDEIDSKHSTILNHRTNNTINVKNGGRRLKKRRNLKIGSQAQALLHNGMKSSYHKIVKQHNTIHVIPKQSIKRLLKISKHTCYPVLSIYKGDCRLYEKPNKVIIKAIKGCKIKPNALQILDQINTESSNPEKYLQTNGNPMKMNHVKYINSSPFLFVKGFIAVERVKNIETGRKNNLLSCLQSSALQYYKREYNPKQDLKIDPENAAFYQLCNYVAVNPLTIVIAMPNATPLSLFLRGLVYNPVSDNRINDPSHQRKLAIREILLNRMPQWFYQLASAMRFLNEHVGITHAFLRADSIYLKNPHQIILDDYYFNMLIDVQNLSSKQRMQYIQRNYRWLPNECFDEGSTFCLDAKTDAWSFGVTIWELISFGQIPYHDMSLAKYVNEITTGYRLPHPVFCGIGLYKLMIQCWLQYPHIRPSFSKICEDMLDILSKPLQNFHGDMVFTNGIFKTFIFGLQHRVKDVGTTNKKRFLSKINTVAPKTYPKDNKNNVLLGNKKIFFTNVKSSNKWPFEQETSTTPNNTTEETIAHSYHYIDAITLESANHTQDQNKAPPNRVASINSPLDSNKDINSFQSVNRSIPTPSTLLYNTKSPVVNNNGFGFSLISPMSNNASMLIESDPIYYTHILRSNGLPSPFILTPLGGPSHLNHQLYGVGGGCFSFGDRSDDVESRRMLLSSEGGNFDGSSVPEPLTPAPAIEWKASTPFSNLSINNNIHGGTNAFTFDPKHRYENGSAVVQACDGKNGANNGGLQNYYNMINLKHGKSNSTEFKPLALLNQNTPTNQNDITNIPTTNCESIV